jgi:hypothetical protein
MSEIKPNPKSRNSTTAHKDNIRQTAACMGPKTQRPPPKNILSQEAPPYDFSAVAISEFGRQVLEQFG